MPVQKPKKKFIMGWEAEKVWHLCRFNDLDYVESNHYDEKIRHYKCRVCSLPWCLCEFWNGQWMVGINDFSTTWHIDPKHKEHCPLLPSSYWLKLHLHNF